MVEGVAVVDPHDPDKAQVAETRWRASVLHDASMTQVLSAAGEDPGDSWAHPETPQRRIDQEAYSTYFAGRRRVPCVTVAFFAPDDLFRFFCFDGTAACPLAIRFAVGLCEENVR